MEDENRHQKLKAGKEKLAQFQRKKKKKKPTAGTTPDSSNGNLESTDGGATGDTTVHSPTSPRSVSGDLLEYGQDSCQDAQQTVVLAAFQSAPTFLDSSQPRHNGEPTRVSSDQYLLGNGHQTVDQVSASNQSVISQDENQSTNVSSQSEPWFQDSVGVSQSEPPYDVHEMSTGQSEAVIQTISMDDVNELVSHVQWLQAQLRQSNGTLKAQTDQQKTTVRALMKAKTEISMLQTSILEKDQLMSRLAEKMTIITEEYGALKKSYAELKDNQTVIEKAENPDIQKENSGNKVHKAVKDVSAITEKSEDEDAKQQELDNLRENYETLLKERAHERDALHKENEDLKIVSDEVMKQNELLTNQCETLTKGLKFMKEEHEKTVNELSELSAELGKMKEEQDKFDSDRTAFEEQMAMLEEGLRLKEEEKCVLSDTVKDLTETVSQLREQLKTSEDSLENASTTNDLLKLDNTVLAEEIEKMKKDIVTLCNDNTKINEENSEFKKQLGALEEQLEFIDQGALAEENHSLRLQIDELNNKVNDEKDFIANLNSDLNSLKDEKLQMSVQLADLESELRFVHKANADLQGEKEQYTTQIADLEAQLCRYKLENSDVKDKNVILSSEIMSLRDQLKDSETMSKMESIQGSDIHITDKNIEEVMEDMVVASSSSQNEIIPSSNPIETFSEDNVVKERGDTVHAKDEKIDLLEKELSHLRQLLLNRSATDIVNMAVSSATKICSENSEQPSSQETNSQITEALAINDTAYYSMPDESLSSASQSSVPLESSENCSDGFTKQAFENLQLQLNTLREELKQSMEECERYRAEVKTLNKETMPETNTVSDSSVKPMCASPPGLIGDQDENSSMNSSERVSINDNVLLEVSPVLPSSGTVDGEVNLHASSSPGYHGNPVLFATLASSKPGNLVTVTGECDVVTVIGDVDKDVFQTVGSDNSKAMGNDILGDIDGNSNPEVSQVLSKNAQGNSFEDSAKETLPEYTQANTNTLKQQENDIEHNVLGSEQSADKKPSPEYSPKDIVGLKSEIVKLKQENERMSAQISILSEQEVNITEELNMEQEISKKLRKDCDNIGLAMEQVQHKLEGKEAELRKMELEKKDVEYELEKVTWERDELEHKVSNFEKEIMDIKTAKCDIEFEKGKFHEELNRVKERLEYLESSDSDVIEIKEMLDVIQEEREKCSQENEKLQCSLSAQLEENERLLETLDSYNKENSVLLENLKQISSDNEELKTGVMTTTKRKLELENEFECILKEKQSLEARFNGEIEGLMEENSTLKTTVQMKDSEIEQQTTEIKRLSSFFPNIDKVSDDVNVLSSKNEELEKRLTEVMNDNEIVVTELADFQKKLSEASEENEVLLDKCEEYQRVINDLDDEKTGLLETVSKLNDDVSVKLQDNTAFIEKYEMQMEALDQENSTLKTKVIQLEDERSVIEERLIAVELEKESERDVLNSKITVMEGSGHDLRNQLQYLNEENDNLKVKWSSCEHDIVELQQREHYLLDQLKVYEESLKTKDKGSVSSGGIELLAGQLEVEKKYKAQLQSNIDKLQSKFEEVTKENEGLRSELCEKEKRSNENKKEIEKIKGENISLTSKVDRLVTEKEKLRKFYVDQQKLCKDKEKENHVLNDELNNATASLEFISCNREHLRSQIEILSSEVERLSAENLRMNVQCTEHENLNRTLDEENRTLNEEIRIVEQEKEAVQTENELMKSDIEMMKEEVEILQTDLEKHMLEKVEALKNENEELEKQHSEVERLTQELENEKVCVEQLQQEVSGNQKEMEALRSENVELKKRLNKSIQTKESKETIKENTDEGPSSEEKEFDEMKTGATNQVGDVDSPSLARTETHLREKLNGLEKLLDEYLQDKKALAEQIEKTETQNNFLRKTAEGMTGMLRDMQSKYEEVASCMESSKKVCEKEISHLQTQLQEMNEEVTALRELLTSMEDEMHDSLKQKLKLKEVVKSLKEQLKKVTVEKEKLEKLLDSKQQKDYKNMSMSQHRASSHSNECANNEVDDNTAVDNDDDSDNEGNEIDNAHNDYNGQDNSETGETIDEPDNEAVMQLAEAISSMSETLSDLNETYELPDEMELSNASSIIPSFESAFQLLEFRDSEEDRKNRHVQTNLSVGEFQSSGFLIDDNGEESLENRKEVCITSSGTQTDISDLSKFMNSKTLDISIQGSMTEDKYDFMRDTKDSDTQTVEKELVVVETQTVDTMIESESATFVEQEYISETSKQTKVKKKKNLNLVYLTTDGTNQDNFGDRNNDNTNSSGDNSDDTGDEDYDKSEMSDGFMGSVSVMSTDSGIQSATVMPDDRNVYRLSTDNQTEYAVRTADVSLNADDANKPDMTNQSLDIDRDVSTVEANSLAETYLTRTCSIEIQTDVDFESLVEEIEANIHEDLEEEIRIMESKVEERVKKQFELREHSIKVREDSYEKRVAQMEYDIEEQYEQKFRLREVEVVLMADRDKKAHADEVERDAQRQIERVKMEKDQQFVATLQKVKADFEKRSRKRSGEKVRRTVSEYVTDGGTGLDVDDGQAGSQTSVKGPDVGPQGDNKNVDEGNSQLQQLQEENKELATARDDLLRRIDANDQEQEVLYQQLLCIMGEQSTMGSNTRQPQNQQPPSWLDWEMSPELSFDSVRSSLDPKSLSGSLDPSSICTNSDCLSVRMKYEQLIEKIQQYLRIKTVEPPKHDAGTLPDGSRDTRGKKAEKKSRKKVEGDMFVENEEPEAQMLQRITSFHLEHFVRAPNQEQDTEDLFLMESNVATEQHSLNNNDIVDLIVNECAENVEGHFSENELEESDVECDIDTKQTLARSTQLSPRSPKLGKPRRFARKIRDRNSTSFDDDGHFSAEDEGDSGKTYDRKRRHKSESDLVFKLAAEANIETSRSDNTEGQFVFERSDSPNDSVDGTKSLTNMNTVESLTDDVFNPELQSETVEFAKGDVKRIAVNKGNTFIDEGMRREDKPPGTEEVMINIVTTPKTGEESGDFFGEKVVLPMPKSLDHTDSHRTHRSKSVKERFDSGDILETIAHDLPIQTIVHEKSDSFVDEDIDVNQVEKISEEISDELTEGDLAHASSVNESFVQEAYTGAMAHVEHSNDPLLVPSKSPKRDMENTSPVLESNLSENSGTLEHGQRSYENAVFDILNSICPGTDPKRRPGARSQPDTFCPVVQEFDKTAEDFSDNPVEIDVNDLLDKYQTMQSTIDEVLKENAELKDKLEASEISLNELEVLKEKLTILEEENACFHEKSDTVSSGKYELTEKLQALESENAKIRIELETNKQNTWVKEELQKKTTEMEHEIESLNNDAKTMTEELETRSKELMTLQEKIYGLQVELQDKDEHFKNQQSEDEMRMKEILEKLRIECDTNEHLKSKVETTENSLNSAQEVNQRLRSELDKLKNENSIMKELKERYDSVSDNQDELKTQVENLVHERCEIQNRLEAERVKAAEERHELEQALFVHDDINKQLDSKLDYMNDRNEALEIKLQTEQSSRVEMEKEMIQFQNELTNLKQVNTELSQNIECLTTDNERLKLEDENNNQVILNLKHEKELMNEELRELKTKLSDSEAKIKEKNMKITQLEEATADLEKVIDELKRNLESVGHQISKLENDVETLNGEKQLLEESNEKVISENAALKIQVPELTTRIGELTCQKNSLEMINNEQLLESKAKLQEKENQIEEKNSEIEMVKGTNISLENQILQLTDSMEELKHTISNLEEKIETLKSEKQSLAESHCQIETKNDSLQHQISELKGKLAELSSEKDSLEKIKNEQLKVLETRNDDTEHEIREKDTKIHEMGETIACLENTIVGLNDNIETLKPHVIQLEQDLHTLKIEKQSLEESNEIIQLENDTAQSQISELTANVKELTGEKDLIEHMKDELNTLRPKVELLRTENSNLNEKLVENISEIESLKSELEPMKELETKYTSIITKLTELSSAKDTFVKQIQDYEIQIKSLTERNSELETRNTENEWAIRELDNQLQEQVKETKEVTDKQIWTENEDEKSYADKSVETDVENKIRSIDKNEGTETAVKKVKDQNVGTDSEFFLENSINVSKNDHGAEKDYEDNSVGTDNDVDVEIFEREENINLEAELTAIVPATNTVGLGNFEDKSTETDDFKESDQAMNVRVESFVQFKQAQDIKENWLKYRNEISTDGEIEIGSSYSISEIRHELQDNGELMSLKEELENVKTENTALKERIDSLDARSDSETDLQILQDMREAIKTLKTEKTEMERQKSEVSDSYEKDNRRMQSEIEELLTENDHLKIKLRLQEETLRNENTEILEMYNDLRNEVEVLVISKHDLEVELHALKDLLEQESFLNHERSIEREHDTSKELTEHDLEEMAGLKHSIEKLKYDMKEKDSYVRKLEEHLLGSQRGTPDFASTPKPFLSHGNPLISKHLLRRTSFTRSRRAFSHDPYGHLNSSTDQDGDSSQEHKHLPVRRALDKSFMTENKLSHVKENEEKTPCEQTSNTSDEEFNKSSNAARDSLDVSARIRSGLKADEDGHLALELKQYELVAEITKLRRDLRETKAVYAQETSLLTDALEKERISKEYRGRAESFGEHNIGSNISHDLLKTRKEVALLREENKVLKIEGDRWLERLKEQENIVADLRERLSRNTSGYGEIEEVFGRQLALLQKQREELIDKLKDKDSQFSSLSKELGEKGIIEESLRKEKNKLLAKLEEKEKIELELTEKKILLEKKAMQQRELEEAIYQKDLSEIELMKQKRVLEEQMKEIEAKFRDREETLDHEKNKLLDELRTEKVTTRSLFDENENQGSVVCSERAAMFSDRNVGRLEIMLEEVERQHAVAVNVLKDQLRTKYMRRESEIRRQHGEGLAKLKYDTNRQVN